LGWIEMTTFYVSEGILEKNQKGKQGEVSSRGKSAGGLAFLKDQKGKG